ncbi:protease inhibitor I42 family protein [Streptomyces sp. NPDC052396]|uniref:protease inhibitor I42 family protein n=1 Tax=Streptomyces sp. NPDC052396 TaxID=3365689 RepID=UPI0037CF52E2
MRSISTPSRLLACAAVLLMVTGCDSDDATSGNTQSLGTVHRDRIFTNDPNHPTPQNRTEGPIETEHGKRFSIAMLENASARLEWSASDPQPAGYLKAAGTSTEDTSGNKHAVGGGYTLYFTFQGTKPGTARIVFTNYCGTHKNTGCYSPTLQNTVTYRITIH